MKRVSPVCFTTRTFRYKSGIIGFRETDKEQDQKNKIIKTWLIEIDIK